MATILIDKKTREKLAEKTGRTNLHAGPTIDRVIINVGIGRRIVAEGKKAMEPIIKDLQRITGQKPVVRPAKKSIASFKLREGQPAGLVVTLRGKRAEDFLTRLVRVAMPRMRDFRGIKRSAIDAGGNLHIGISEQIVFPETAEEPTGILFGFQVTVVTTAKNRDEGLMLFTQLKFPIAPANEDEQ